MSSLIAHINRFPEVRVLVIGDLILDRFIYGKVDRISPEAPVPVMLVEKEKHMLGGAGNVASNLRALGCQVSFIGVIGMDKNGQAISKELKNMGIESHLLKLPGYATTVKTRYVAGANQITRVDREQVTPGIAERLMRARRLVCRCVQQADIVLISDYGKGLLTLDTSPMIIQACRQAGKWALVDPKGADYSKYQGATLVKPNLKEFKEVTGRNDYEPRQADFEKKLTAGAQQLLEKFELGNLLITLSEHGMALLSASAPEHLLRIQTQAKEVFDVSGAGDTSLATLGAALGAGATLRDAMSLANMASGIVVGKLGTATVTAAELLQALNATDLAKEFHHPGRKIVALDQAERIIPLLKAQRKVVGMTSGAYDCCHYGILSSLYRAKERCDVLVVALRSDASLRCGTCGAGQDEKTRSMLLASLEYVDYVVVFDEESPQAIVRKIRPDVLVQDGYSDDSWAPEPLARECGAQFVKLPQVEG